MYVMPFCDSGKEGQMLHFVTRVIILLDDLWNTGWKVHQRYSSILGVIFFISVSQTERVITSIMVVFCSILRLHW